METSFKKVVGLIFILALSGCGKPVVVITVTEIVKWVFIGILLLFVLAVLFMDWAGRAYEKRKQKRAARKSKTPDYD